MGSTEDMVAAFVGDEVRGVVNGLAIPPFLGGGHSFNIMIYSNPLYNACDLAHINIFIYSILASISKSFLII